MFDRQNKSLKHLTFAVEGLAKTSKYKLSKRKKHHSSTSIMAALYLMLQKKTSNATVISDTEQEAKLLLGQRQTRIQHFKEVSQTD